MTDMLRPMGYEIYAGFAKRLIELCNDKKMPERGRQAELARLCGIKPASVNKWFSAVSLPDATNLLKIASWAGSTVDWLLDERGPKYPSKEYGHDPRIAHVLKIMEGMPEYKIDQAVKIIDTIAEPIPNGGSDPGKKSA